LCARFQKSSSTKNQYYKEREAVRLPVFMRIGGKTKMNIMSDLCKLYAMAWEINGSEQAGIAYNPRISPSDNKDDKGNPKRSNNRPNLRGDCLKTEIKRSSKKERI
jgi:hypothetical protein